MAYRFLLNIRSKHDTAVYRQQLVSSACGVGKKLCAAPKDRPYDDLCAYSRYIYPGMPYSIKGRLGLEHPYKHMGDRHGWNRTEAALVQCAQVAVYPVLSYNGLVDCNSLCSLAEDNACSSHGVAGGRRLAVYHRWGYLRNEVAQVEIKGIRFPRSVSYFRTLRELLPLLDDVQIRVVSVITGYEKVIPWERIVLPGNFPFE